MRSIVIQHIAAMSDTEVKTEKSTQTAPLSSNVVINPPCQSVIPQSFLRCSFLATAERLWVADSTIETEPGAILLYSGWSHYFLDRWVSSVQKHFELELSC